MVVSKKEQILSEILSTTSLPDQEATDILWVLLARITNAGGDGVSQRPVSLKLSEVESKRLLKDASVDALIFMDPPLETMFANPGEVQGEGSVMRIIGRLRSGRDSEPIEALSNLLEVLGQIHDMRVNGFDAVTENQIKEIEKLSRRILYLLCMSAVSNY